MPIVHYIRKYYYPELFKITQTLFTLSNMYLLSEHKHWVIVKPKIE